MQIQTVNSTHILMLPQEILDQVFHSGDIEPKDLVTKSRVCKIFHRCIMVVSNSHYWKISVSRYFPFKITDYRFRSPPLYADLFKTYVIERKKIGQAKAAYFTLAKGVAMDLAKALFKCGKPCLANTVLQPFLRVAPLDRELNHALKTIRTKLHPFNLIELTTSSDGSRDAPGPIYIMNEHPSPLVSNPSTDLLSKIDEYKKTALPLALSIGEAVFQLNDPQEVTPELYAILYPFNVLSAQSGHLHFLFYKIHSLPGSSFYNKRAAMEHLGQSANHNYPPGLLALADIDAEGLRSNRNYERAFTFYQLAAERGNRLASTRLGKCFENGVGKKADLTRARLCYIAAEDLGCPEGSLRLGLYLKAYDEHASPELIYSLFCKATEAGLAEGAYHKGLCLESGFGVMKDLEQAKKWYQAASDAKHSGAASALIKMTRPHPACSEVDPPAAKRPRVETTRGIE
ncbi:F-box/SEL1-like repeat protein [Estrella lausannensis]|uniref:F-box domain-containing protein n=1 Tax=Estrella lausannensis TaxID=483423 RepID=A0A0H5DT66_9BACT|nr:F-box/SEL1-like repeat protein [Estrella lausannensis]CRX39558.1 hypothetical protein ELAC_2238 [Estrella lausannensis]